MIYIKYGPHTQGLREVHVQPQKVDRSVKKSEEIKRKLEKKKNKQLSKERSQKLSPHPKEEQEGVETKRRSSKVHHHTTKNKQNGVEAKEGAALRIHFSRIGRSIIEQEMNGEGSYSSDLKR
jgi:Zn-dependent metalloprotease